MIDLHDIAILIFGLLPGRSGHGRSLISTLHLRQSIHSPLVTLGSSSHIPSPREFRILFDADPNLGVVSHRVFRLAQALVGGSTRPKVGLPVALLQDTFASRQIPSTQCQLRFRITLFCSLRVPCNRATRVDGTRYSAVLVALAELVLGRGISKLCRLGEERLCVDGVMLYER